MYRTYHFSGKNIVDNLREALADWLEERRQSMPQTIAVNPRHLSTAQGLTPIKVVAVGGCLVNEVWVEPSVVIVSDQ